MEVDQTTQPSEAQPSTSVVNVIPLDPASPEATINAPQAVRRYLTRWPRGDKAPHEVFENTNLHDWRTMHNTQDDERRRADIAKDVPRHVNVSLPISASIKHAQYFSFTYYYFDIFAIHFIYYRVVLGSGSTTLDKAFGCAYTKRHCL